MVVRWLLEPSTREMFEFLTSRLIFKELENQTLLLNFIIQWYFVFTQVKNRLRVLCSAQDVRTVCRFGSWRGDLTVSKSDESDDAYVSTEFSVESISPSLCTHTSNRLAFFSIACGASARATESERRSRRRVYTPRFDFVLPALLLSPVRGLGGWTGGPVGRACQTRRRHGAACRCAS